MEGKRDGKWNNIIRKSDGEAAIRFAAGREKDVRWKTKAMRRLLLHRIVRCGVVLVSNYSRSGDAARAMTGAVSPAAAPLQFLHFAFYSFCHSPSVSLEKK